MLQLQEKVLDLEEDLKETKKDIEKLTEMQMKHEHLDEIRAVKQDQLMSNIQSLVSSFQGYQRDLHEMTLKNTEDISKQDIKLEKTSTRVKILYAACAVVGGAILTGIFEWLPQIIQLMSKGK
jgi:hypothetical protein